MFGHEKTGAKRKGWGAKIVVKPERSRQEWNLARPKEKPQIHYQKRGGGFSCTPGVPDRGEGESVTPHWQKVQKLLRANSSLGRFSKEGERTIGPERKGEMKSSALKTSFYSRSNSKWHMLSGCIRHPVEGTMESGPGSRRRAKKSSRHNDAQKKRIHGCRRY